MKLKPIVLGIVVVLGVLRLMLDPLMRSASQGAPMIEPWSRLSLTPMPMPNSEKLEDWQPDGPAPKEIPEDIRRETDDPYVAEVLMHYKKGLPQFGNVVITEKGLQQLWDGKRLLFEAKRIWLRSRAADGTLVLEVEKGVHTPIDQTKEADVVGSGDNVGLISKLREIWIVTREGERIRLSPPNISAHSPVIDPSGRYVAFSGWLMDDRGISVHMELFVGDVKSGRYRVFAELKPQDDYHVRAVDWVKNGTVLRVLQGHAKTKHLELKQVRMK